MIDKVKRTINGHEWMRALRFEMYQLNKLRQLRVGESLFVAAFESSDIMGRTHQEQEHKGTCSIYFERVKGGYTFQGLWLINWEQRTFEQVEARKKQFKTTRGWRAHVWATGGKFKILKGGIIEFASDDDVLAEQNFRLICRYTAFINRHLKHYGYSHSYLEVGSRSRHIMWRGSVINEYGNTQYGYSGPNDENLSYITRSPQ